MQSVRGIGIDDDLGVEPPDRGRERDDMDDRGDRVEDAPGRHQDRGMEEPGFPSLGDTQIEIDHVTRGRHRARLRGQQVDRQPVRRSCGFLIADESSREKLIVLPVQGANH